VEKDFCDFAKFIRIALLRCVWCAPRKKKKEMNEP
jgi:hypothetical protein